MMLGMSTGAIDGKEDVNRLDSLSRALTGMNGQCERICLLYVNLKVTGNVCHARQVFVWVRNRIARN